MINLNVLGFKEEEKKLFFFYFWRKKSTPIALNPGLFTRQSVPKLNLKLLNSLTLTGMSLDKVKKKIFFEKKNIKFKLIC